MLKQLKEKYKDDLFISDYINSKDVNLECYASAQFYTEFKKKKDQIVLFTGQIQKIWLVHYSALDNVKAMVFLHDGPAPKHNMDGVTTSETDMVFRTANFLKGKYLLREGARYILKNYENFGDKDNFVKLLKAKTDKMKKLRLELLGYQDDQVTECMLRIKLFSLEELNNILTYNINENTKLCVMNAIDGFSDADRKKYAESKERKDDLAVGITEYTLKDLKTDFACKKENGKIVISNYKGKSSTIVIPGSVDGITEFVFKSFKLKDNVNTIIFDEGITKVSIHEDCNHVFTKCEYLFKIQLPSTLTYIDGEIFSNIPYDTIVDLSRLDNPDFKYIDTHYLCFKNKLLFIKNRTDIREIVLPESITEVSHFSFKSCRKLILVILHNKLTKFENFSFSKSRKITTIKMPDCTTCIPDEAFRECDRLETIDFNNVKTIGSFAFKKCSGFTNLVVPETVLEIYDGAFSYCYNLESIKLPSHLTELPANILLSCGSLRNFEIPENVQIIDYRSLSCTNIRELIIPKSVKSIIFGAFEFADKMTLHIQGDLEELNEHAFYCGDEPIIYAPKPTVERKWHKDYKDCIKWI